MEQKTQYAPLLLALVLCASSLPATASLLFSDLGPGNSYNANSGLTIGGSGTLTTSYDAASLFTVTGPGSTPEPVAEIDVAVGYVLPPGTFSVAIWTDSAGAPGVQVAGADWTSETTTTGFGNCCGVVSITGITGVTLISNTQYFMVLGPVNPNDSSDNEWNLNNQGVFGVDLSSTGGGAWTNSGTILAAFDVIGAPEPSTWLMIAAGAAAILLRNRYRRLSRG